MAAKASPEVYDVIVVGAGVSGLAAAKRILELNPNNPLRLAVVEARNRMGGRIHTVHSHRLDLPDQLHSGPHAVDLGASFVHGVDGGNPLKQLSREIPFALHSPNEKAPFVIYSADAAGKPMDTDVSERLEFLSHSTTFSRLHEIAQMSGQEPGINDSISSALVLTPAGEGVWAGISEQDRATLLALSKQWAGWTGAELHRVSLKYWGFEQEYPGEDAVVKDGYGSLIKWLADAVRSRGGEIKLSCQVQKMERDDEAQKITIKMSSPDGPKALRARYVLSSLPLGVLQSSAGLMFEPPLPVRRQKAILRLGYGILNKVILTYPKAWWHNASRPSGSAHPAWLSVLPKGFDSEADPASGLNLRSADSFKEVIGKTTLLLQDYSQITGDNALVAFAGPSFGYRIESETDEVVGNAYHERLVEALLPKDAEAPPAPSQVLVTRWASDPLSCGSYSFIPPGGASPLDMMELGHPLWHGTLGFCGEHTHPDCYASVHGALLSGQREGDRIGYAISDALAASALHSAGA